MKLIVGLGNPGTEYDNTRHNIGFIVIDEIAKELNVSKYTVGFKGLYAKVHYGQETVLLLKPQTFVNLSGESIREIVRYFKIDLADVLVIIDDMDLALGRLKLKYKGSSGGHNGLKSIELHLQTQEYKRLKFGIGRNSLIPTKNYVLGKFTAEEMELVKKQAQVAKNACLEFIDQDFTKIMTKYN